MLKPILIFLSAFMIYTGITAQSQISLSEKIYTRFEIQKQPTFPGDEQALKKFLKENISYTEEAITKKIEGVTTVQFVVEKDGSLTNIKTVKDIGGGLGAVATKIISSSPNWVPGEADGKIVRVEYEQHIVFRLKDAVRGNLHMVADTSPDIIITELFEPPAEPLDPDTKVYEPFELQVAPQFPGGHNALRKYLADSLYFTQLAYNNKISGTVGISFIIEKDGSISNCKVVMDPGGLGNVVIEMMRTLPKWSPGIIKNKPVRTRYVEHVVFILDEYSRVKQPDGKFIQLMLTARDTLGDIKVYEPGEEDEKPGFPGGIEAMKQYFKAHVNYSPEGKFHTKFEFPMYEFTVEKDGTVSSIRIHHDPGYGMGMEGYRVIRMMPKWMPALKNNKPVRANYRLKLDFI